MDRLQYLLDRFEAEYHVPRSITEERRYQTERALRRLAAIVGDRPLDQLTPRDLTLFVGAELERGVKPTTARKTLVQVKAFVTWAAEAGVIEPERSDQLKAVRNPRGSAARFHPLPYTAAEIRDFKALLAEKYPVMPRVGRGSRAMVYYDRGYVPRIQRHLWRHAKRLQWEAHIALALEEGLRCIEIHSLTIAALHPDNDDIVVLNAKQEPGRNVRRAIPYTGHAREVIAQWLDLRLALGPPHGSPWLRLDMFGPKSNQLAPLDFDRMLRSFESTFGKSKWRWHRFRHTAATEWLRAGVPLENIQIFMGHSSMEQTRAYAQILARDVSRSFEAAEAAFAKRLGLAA